LNFATRKGKYDLDFKNPKTDESKWIDGQELTNLYLEFIKDFPVVSIEDPFDQDHWDAWTNITANTNIQVQML
jgi:enolase